MPGQPSRESRGEPVFDAPGVRGHAGTLLMTASMRGTGLAAVPLVRTLGLRRYRYVERRVARAVLRGLRLRVDLDGGEHARGGPYVVLPLHESLLDPLVVSLLPLPLRFVARDELWGWRSVGAMLRAGRHLEMSEAGDARSGRRLLAGAREALAGGESVVVFPQGTVLGVEVAFRRGALLLARRLGVPVLPVVIGGTHRAYDFPFSARVHAGLQVRMTVLPARSGDMTASEFEGLEREMRARALADPAYPARRFVPERDGYWEDYRYEIAPEFPLLRDAVARRREGGEGVADSRPPQHPGHAYSARAPGR